MPLLAWLAMGVGLQTPDTYTLLREAMVRQHIEARGVRDQAVLNAMRSTPRHLFVPAALRDAAYLDGPLPIGYDATISQPFIVAWMTELLQPSPSLRVLEIGTGSGYQAAVLSPLVRQVYSIEIVPELAAQARERLGRLGYRNITVRAGDGYAGWPEEAPFDRIILTAAPAAIPNVLLAQLAKGGRLVAPVGPGRNQELVVVVRDAGGGYRRENVGAVLFVPMKPEKR